MRHGVLAGLLGAAAVLAVVPGGPAGGSAAARATPATTMITYRGLRIAVPAVWPVHRLDARPDTCVRFDRHAVYLGRPGPQPMCPARVVGRTEALHVEPLSAPANARQVVRSDRLAGYTVGQSTGMQVTLSLPEAGVRITGSYGADRNALQSTLRSARLSAGPGAVQAEESRMQKVQRVGKSWTTGKGFDTCTAPSLWAMQAWRRTYGVANIYIGGAARGCAQPNLTRSWVSSVRRMGYRLIPTYVGLQAPCTAYTSRFTTKNARAEGYRAANDAVARARALGIPSKKPIYFDIEAYDSRQAWCRQAVLAFLHSWSARLVALRYVSGVYSSAGSGIRDLGWATGITKPKAIWFGHWDGKAQLYGGPYLKDWWWHPHRRIKQYRGGHNEKHGGVTINVDSNIVDGRVY